MRIFYFFVFLFFAWNSGFANELKLTTNPDAVCNNGEQATYTIKKAKSKKWAIILPGGGVARNADEYKSRSEGMKSPEISYLQIAICIHQHFVQHHHPVKLLPIFLILLFLLYR